MELKNIKELLTTIAQYHTVTINQTFSKTGEDWVNVRCIPETRVLEVTYVQTHAVEHYTSIDEAASAIARQIN